MTGRAPDPLASRRSAVRQGLAAACLAAAVVMSAGAPARANDSTAELRMGGLILKRTKDIAMVREDLAISPDAVTVRYLLRNLTDHAVTETIAFPLPDIDFGATQMVDLAIPLPDKANFVGFETTIDGTPAALTLEQSAFVNGRDVSAALKRARIPLGAWTVAANEAIAALPRKTARALLRREILSDVTGVVSPNWVLHTALVRTETFAPGRDVRVEHRYRPSVGTSVDTGLGDRGDPEVAADYRKTYCLGAEGLDAIDALRRKGGKRADLPERRISYILKTAANWARPIDSFSLRVETGGPDVVLATCFKALHASAPGVFEAKANDFLPGDDLELLLVGR